MQQRTLSRACPNRSAHSRQARRLASTILLASAAWLAVGNARADEVVEVEQTVALKGQALGGQWADVGTTGVGLALGAAEANPLGLLTLGMKAYAYQQIQEAPPVEQPRLWSAYGAFGWGAAANNVCVIAAIASGGAAAALCPLIGLAAGIGTWNGDEAQRDRATFAAICEEQRQINPNLTCTYTDPHS